MVALTASENREKITAPLQKARSVEPGTRAESGAEILAAAHAFIGRFVAYPSEHAHVAHTLWIVHTHLMNEWETTPRLAFLSPEPASGKSRALEATAALVPRPVHAVNVTPAYLFRKVGGADGLPTVLHDEIDTVFGPRAKESEEIRGLLNAGHRKGAVAGRCVVRGKQVFTEEIPAYCAVALAGLGGLPDTILSRSVVIRMRRRAPGERIEPYRARIHEPQGRAIGERLAAWCVRVAPAIELPGTMPSQIQDRDADVWESLIAVADAAGGDWPERARNAAVSLVLESKQSTPSLGILLLTDLRQVFDETGTDALPTERILTALHALEDSPWADLRGKPLDARGLSYRLRQYGIGPKQVRVGESSLKGYTREAFFDTWARYLPASPRRETSETGETNAGDPANVSDVSPVSLLPATEGKL
ncbi:MAG: DUF3631 domain-containing protein [Gammaproteobacteria bacterium]|nr:DUF3631 domain-containing protein [Gammaproteobacteria bacterium]